jgi:nicotinate-nucleotide adenylyltransferase
MKSIAIYGGSFDPPHLGHVMVPSHLLLNDPSIDQIVIIPCFHQVGKNLKPFSDRLQMCEDAFGWLPRVSVSPIERDLGGESITVRTVKALKEHNPDWRVSFVIGSDLMDKAPYWRGWNELILEATPIIIGRAGIPTSTGPTPIAPAVSSTIVRESLKYGNYCEAERYLPKKVLQYIQQTGLYEVDGLEEG